MEFESGHTQLFGSTEGPVTGCSRLQMAGNPEASSAAAAKGCAGVMMVDSRQMGGRRRGYKKGTRSVTRFGHKDFETYKGSKRYSEKRLKKLIGRKTMRAPIFPFAGGKRRSYHNTKKNSNHTMKSYMSGGYKKGRKSFTRRGRKDFETYKGSKMYNEKRFKKLFGRKTVRAPFFPYSGGQAQSQPLDDDTASLPDMTATGQSSSVYDQLDAGSSMNGGPDLTGGSRRIRHRGGMVDHNLSIKGDHSGNLYYGGRRLRRHHYRGGNCQYGNNSPIGFGQSYGGIELNASNSALANPVPYTPYNHCMK